MNGKNILLVLLVLIVAGGLVVGGFFLGREFSDKKVQDCEVDTTENKEEKVNLTNNDMVGYWEYSTEVYSEDFGKNIEIYYSYAFAIDGTFEESAYTGGTEFGSLGTYVIEGDKITLYRHYSTGSDISVYPLNPHVIVTLTMNEDGTLTGVDRDNKEIVYKKNTSDETDTFRDLDGYITYLENALSEGF